MRAPFLRNKIRKFEFFEAAWHLYFHQYFPPHGRWPCSPWTWLVFINSAAYCARDLQDVWRRDGYSEKSHTIQAFHTAHIVLERERNSNVTSHYIKAFVRPNMRQLFSSILFFCFFFLLLAIQQENFVCYCREMTQVQSPRISFKHLKRKKPSFKHFVAAPYRASPTLDPILLLAGPAGWCCVWCHGPSARGPGLNFPWAEICPAEVPFGFMITKMQLWRDEGL